MSSRYLALFALALLLFGCSSGPSPKEVMLKSIEKAEKMSSIYVELDMNVTTASSDGASIASATVAQWVSGERSRSDIHISGVAGLEGVALRVYSLANGSYVCGKTDAWDCVQLSNGSSLSGEVAEGPFSFTERSRKLLSADALEFTGGVEALEIAGRKCSLVSAKINYTKAQGVDPQSFPNGITGAFISQCLDDETGIALMGKTTIEEGTAESGTAVSQLDMMVKRIEPNAGIQEDVFDLPK